MPQSITRIFYTVNKNHRDGGAVRFGRELKRAKYMTRSGQAREKVAPGC